MWGAVSTRIKGVPKLWAEIGGDPGTVKTVWDDRRVLDLTGQSRLNHSRNAWWGMETLFASHPPSPGPKRARQG